MTKHPCDRLGPVRGLRLRWLAVAAMAGLAVAATVLPAAAQENARVLMERIDRVERDLNMVQRQLYRGGIPSSAAPNYSSSSSGGDVNGDTAARLQQRLADIETVVTTLTGQVEEAKFEVGQVRSRLEKLVGDVDYRLTEIERRLGGDHGGGAAAGEDPSFQARPPAAKAGGGGGAAARPGANRPDREAIATFGKPPGQDEPIGGPAKPGTPPGKGGAPNDAELAALPKGSAKEQYEYISSLLSQANYPAAEKALIAFMEAHGDDPLAGNAQYWLGETYYVRGDFRQAAVAFAKGYQKYPKSGKAAANVLKLGLALAKLERVQDACTAFNRLATEFPNAPGDIKQRAALEKKQLGCK